SQQRERPSLPVDAELARRKGHVAAGAAAALPDREANEFEAGEWAVAEAQFRVGELAGRAVRVVRGDRDRHVRLLRRHRRLVGTRVVRFPPSEEEPPRGPRHRPLRSEPRRLGTGVPRALARTRTWRTRDAVRRVSQTGATLVEWSGDREQDHPLRISTA